MIYIISHKNVEIKKVPGYKYLQVGYDSQNFPGYLRDNSGDNIANKNKNYCELTGVYWVWKNASDQYKGIVHYRRFFGEVSLTGKKHIYSEEYLVNQLKMADIILPKKVCYHVNAEHQLCLSSCTEETFHKLKSVVEEMYPECCKAFEDFFSQNKAAQYNMMLCRQEIFDEYCMWLFQILFELEKTIDYSSFTDYQMRIYGFLSERLLNVWVQYKQLKVKYIDVINEDYTLMDNLTYSRRNLSNELRYLINKRRE